MVNVVELRFVETQDGNLDHQHLIRGMKALVRDGIEFEVESVDKIQKSSCGKRVICRQYLEV